MMKWFVFMHSVNSVGFKEVKMNSNLVLFFIFLIFSAVHAQKDSIDTDDPTSSKVERKPSDKPLKSNPTSTEKDIDDPQRYKTNFLVTPNNGLIINPRIEPQLQQDISNLGVPLGFTNSAGQRFFLSDTTGRYDIQLQNFQNPKTNAFNTALGAISAHIIGQRTNQEYIPYPPNGDPYNYPAYRGYPHATEPPVVRAYETANNANYGTQPSANFDQYSSRRILPNNGYQGFTNQFNDFGLGFYNNPYVFNNGFYSGLRRNDQFEYEDRYLDRQRETYRGPIKRFS